MEIIAVSYNNIGPLRETPVSVFFHQGKYLIDAPIGTGKSFLFFDGPLYGLYKYGERKLLNNLSEHGYIKILFTMGGEYYLIVRNLTPGKTKDSCVSEMYHIANLDLALFKNQSVISRGVDIAELLGEQHIYLEKIVAKNEVDLNMSISSLLPPREVFVNTAFLMQDSGNIFELTPANRLLVLKNIFGLLGIDEMKDKMSGIKRDIQTEKKILSDFSQKDDKLKNGLTKLRKLILFFQEKIDIQAFDFQKYQESFSDLELVYDKVNIEKFALDEQFMVFYQELEKYITTQSKEYTTLQTQKEQKEQQFQTLHHQEQEQKSLLKQFADEKETLEKKIQGSNPEELEQLKTEKKNKYQQLDALMNEELQGTMSDFVKKNPDLFVDFSLHQDYSAMKEIVQYLIDQGKVLKLEQENLENKIQSFSEQILNEKKQAILNIDFQIKQGEQDEKRTQEGNSNSDIRIGELEKILKEKLPFYKEKIADQYFEQEIQRTTYVDIQEELEKLRTEKEKNLLEAGLPKIQEALKIAREKKGKLEQEIKKLTETPTDFLQENFGEQLSEQQKNKTKISTKITLIKQFLGNLDWKKILDDYQIFVALGQEVKALDQKITQKELLAKELKQYQEDVVAKQLAIQQAEKQILHLDGEKSKLQEEILSLKTHLASESYQSLPLLLESLRELDNTLHALQSLLLDHQDILLKVKKITQEEVLAKNLYTIFSKDLLLFVLEDNLPVLSDIINNFLAHVVDFSLDMKLVQKGNSLELETMIQDEKGKRETKSLSGGQKVVLKLVWMLSVAVYLQSKMLFLDETINNLDPESIGKVSELIKNFVQQNQMKMYIITHSSEIKSMNIWDGNIDLVEELGI